MKKAERIEKLTKLRDQQRQGIDEIEDRKIALRKELDQLNEELNATKYELEDTERQLKRIMPKETGFARIVVNQFSGGWDNINSVYDRPQFIGTAVFVGPYKGDWLTDENGKRHKMNGNQVVSCTKAASLEELKERVI